MRETDYLIVGGGLAAASAVDGIRARDPEGSILVLTDEAMPPYHRPPLSKEYLQIPEAGRDLLHVKPEGWFGAAGNADLMTGARVLTLDPEKRALVTAGGSAFRGRRLLLVTGGRARRLQLPGSDLEGIFTLRNVEDSERIRTAAGGAGARAGGRVVLVGAGFIGMEIAASLTHFGLSPVIVEVRDRVWPNVLPPDLSRFVQAYFEARGVQFRLRCGVEAFLGERQIQSVRLADGSELKCAFAVVGCGMVPNEELAAQAGLATDDGIRVDAFGETSRAHIYAAGDVARFPDPLSGEELRLEHWDHARRHGRLVGGNMAGGREAYDHVSHFFSDVFDLKLNVVGRPAEAERVIFRGAPGEGPCLAFCIAGEELRAIVLINAGRELEVCRTLLRRPRPLSRIEDSLSDPEIRLDSLIEPPAALDGSPVDPDGSAE